MGTGDHGIACECPVAGYCPRFQRKMIGHLHKICNGERKMDPEKRAAYLAKWAGQEPKPQKPLPKSQVGTRLKEIIRREYGEVSCSKCAAEAQRLNGMSHEEIIAQSAEIAQGMADRAKTLAPKWWQRTGARLLPSEAKRRCLAMLEEALGGPVARFDRDWLGEDYAELRRSLMEETEVVVKSFRRHALLLRFVQSVRQFYPDLKIRVADDSGEMTHEGEVAKSLGIAWHEMPYDSGLPAGRNLGVRESSAKYILLCDDDFVFTEKTDIYALLLPVREGHLDLCGGLIRWENGVAANWCGEFQFKGPIGGQSLDLKAVPASRMRTVLGVRYFPSDITYNFFAARREMLLAHPWDERYKISEEHLDSFLTWHFAGYKVGYTTDSVCDHPRSYDPNYQKLRNRSTHSLNQKWGLVKRPVLPPQLFPGY